MGTKHIAAEIPDEVHKKLAHWRVDEGEKNDVVVTKALAEFFDMEIDPEWFDDSVGDGESDESDDTTE